MDDHNDFEDDPRLLLDDYTSADSLALSSVAADDAESVRSFQRACGMCALHEEIVDYSHTNNDDHNGWGGAG